MIYHRKFYPFNSPFGNASDEIIGIELTPFVTAENFLLVECSKTWESL